MGLLGRMFGAKDEEIGAPVAGEAVSLREVKDQAFSEGMLGEGVAIRPQEGRVCAPCSGTVNMMFETGHAVSLTSASGAQVLIHVGIDTVMLKGKHFKARCQNGEQVKKGQLLVEFDREAIAGAGYDLITPVVICNGGDFERLETVTGQTVAQGDTIIRLTKPRRRRAGDDA